METLTFADPTGAAASALAVSALGAVLGALAYRALTRPPAKTEPFRGLAAFSPRAAVGVGVAVGLVFLVGAYWWHLTTFYTASISDSELVLEYSYPSRSRTIPRAKVERVDRRVELKRGGSAYCAALVYTVDGDRYVSGLGRCEQVDRSILRLREWLAAAPR